MALPSLPFPNFLRSRQLISGKHENDVTALLSSFGQLTALAGGGRSGLTPIINNAFTELTVVATAADSVVLPIAKVGLRCEITNSGVASAQIFANGTDVINATAGNVGVALAAGAAATFYCTKNGVWKRFVSA